MPQPKQVLQQYKPAVSLQDKRYTVAWSYACRAGSRSVFEEGLVKKNEKNAIMACKWPLKNPENTH
jgi:hypothetical protein